MIKDIEDTADFEEIGNAIFDAKSENDQECTPMQNIDAEIKKGTKQWSSISVNCYFGCRHDCRYCYARQMTARFKREKGEWNIPILNEGAFKKGYKLRKGVIMFPTSHDITPDILPNCMKMLDKLLASGNEVLLVSKMHIETARALVKTYANDAIVKTILSVRITIGSDDNEDLKKWEPGAPPFDERLACLKLLHENGFSTSVSSEPVLRVDNIPSLIEKLRAHTSEIWIGKMNYLPRVVKMFPNMKEECDFIKKDQSNERILAVYNKYKTDPLIRWKHSVLLIVKRAKLSNFEKN